MRVAWSGLIGLLVVMAAGCTSGPSLQEAGAQLAADGNAVMAWDDWVDERVTNAATSDVSCGDGTFKRVFTATGQLPTLDADPDSKLDGATRQIGFSFAERGYERDTTGPGQADDVSSRTVVWIKEETGLRFSFTVTLPSDKRIAAQIDGETRCA
ncbi:hypothetical protein Aph01nite_77170 [Acrocarpospora phusangensis]|uniref:Lipoprotein n=1 Tax=Acrocarpospora phusangensis TaxID=1070424 RepID=A0A919QI69_9ACTN|nr:hypothetical protein [Acrocarpospora phusangensis]GIH29407.1 hypothetical protein Aph01nite_77170 [Acrocarpospora phusangensis]